MNIHVRYLSLFVISIVGVVTLLSTCGSGGDDVQLPPKISSISPKAVVETDGLRLLIRGTHLGKASVTIGGVDGSIINRSKNEMTVMIPELDVGTFVVNVTNSEGEDSYDQFQVIGEPDEKYIIEYNVDETVFQRLDNLSATNASPSLLVSDYGLSDDLVTRVNALPYDFVQDLSPEELERLRNDPRVKAVHRNQFRLARTQESLGIIEQPQAYKWGATGAGYAIAILDTGADYSHPDLGSCASFGPNCRVAFAQDFTDVDDGQLDADPDRHGTNVSAISALVAPESSIIALDVFDGQGAKDSDIIKALSWVIEHQAEYNIVAVNLSLGSDKGHTPVCVNTAYDSAFSWLNNIGVTIVAAAGNEAVKDGLSIPSCHPLAVSVGATTDSNIGPTVYKYCKDEARARDEVTCFSNSADSLDLLAPGARISAGGVTQSGTSQAAPHVAGAIAAMKSVYPSASSSELVLKLKQHGQPIVDQEANVRTRRINLAGTTNIAPQATSDSATSLQGGGVVIDVLANDKDPDGSHDDLSIVGVALPTGADFSVRVINKKLYFYSNSTAYGQKQFRYTMQDGYGSTSTAEVDVQIRPFAFSSEQSVSNGETHVSKLGNVSDRHLIIYEEGRQPDRNIWLQRLDSNGKISGQRYSISRGQTEISPNILSFQSDPRGYVASWVKKREIDGKFIVQAVYGNLQTIPQPFHASFDYSEDSINPFVALLDRGMVTAWERSWNPTKVVAQAYARLSDGTPYKSLVDLSNGYVAPSKFYDAVTVEGMNYIAFRNSGYSGKTITGIKSNIEGDNLWGSSKTFPQGSYSNPVFNSETVNSFAVVPTPSGFAAAWTHSVYVGRYRVSFQSFDNDGNPMSTIVTAEPTLSSQGEVDLIRLDNGDFRLFWTELDGDFSAVVSVLVGQDGLISKQRIEAWTEDSNSFGPQKIQAMSLPDDKYMISWSSNARKLKIMTRHEY